MYKETKLFHISLVEGGITPSSVACWENLVPWKGYHNRLTKVVSQSRRGTSSFIPEGLSHCRTSANLPPALLSLFFLPLLLSPGTFPSFLSAISFSSDAKPHWDFLSFTSKATQ